MTARANWFDGAETAAPSPTSGSDPFAGYAGGEMGTTVESPEQPRLVGDPPLTAPSIPGPAPEVGAEAYWCAQDYSMETPLKVLEDRLAVLVTRESNLFNREIVCPMKERPDMTCSACPFHEVGRDTSKSALCRLGKEQERILALIHCKRCGLGGSAN